MRGSGLRWGHRGDEGGLHKPLQVGLVEMAVTVGMKLALETARSVQKSCALTGEPMLEKESAGEW